MKEIVLFLCFFIILYFKDKILLVLDFQSLKSINTRIMKQKLEDLDMDIEICEPGQHNYLLCPMVFPFFYFGPNILAYCFGFSSLLVVVFNFL